MRRVADAAAAPVDREARGRSAFDRPVNARYRDNYACRVSIGSKISTSNAHNDVHLLGERSMKLITCYLKEDGNSVGEERGWNTSLTRAVLLKFVQCVCNQHGCQWYYPFAEAE